MSGRTAASCDAGAAVQRPGLEHRHLAAIGLAARHRAVDWALAMFSAMIRMRDCWARRAEAAIAMVGFRGGTGSGIGHLLAPWAFWPAIRSMFRDFW